MEGRTDKKLKLRVLAPYGSLCDSDVDYVIFRSTEGDAGIQAGHEPFTAALSEGLLVYRANSAAHTLVVLGGIASVLDDQVTVISEIADHPDRIKRTIKELAREKAALAEEEQKGSTGIQIMELGLRRALVRVDVSAYSIIKGRDGVMEFDEGTRGEDDDGNRRGI
ncbi:MAG: F0F1 ATP synthase subunit epsilon [Synergistaceae bacterium]|jgi:F-type H+-transporting ATPase subunit epsilon|nr:F0F1 ATP synthase subunit epsilon [Synergistaceae bacterium]